MNNTVFTFKFHIPNSNVHFSFIQGGYFGLGWFRDIWRIPSYVREANDDPAYLIDLTEKMRTRKKPPFSVSCSLLPF